jgi:3'-phosphoadenosine 5'-phosphosulfate sulfotransferase (PAPS reductase)/FAD synthetase
MTEGHTKERLKALQALPLERKIGFTIARIVEWHTHYNGKVYISFSGGKDSTVLLDIARGLFPDIKAMFVDTGLEYPEIREFVKTFDNVDIVRPKMSFKQVIETYGYPVVSKEVSQCIYEGRGKPLSLKAQRFDATSAKAQSYGGRYSLARYKYLLESEIPISDRCCKVMKKDPAKKYEKQTGLFPIVATMANESRLRESEWIKRGCNAFDTKRPISKPMSFWTEQDVLQYIKLKNIPVASVYGDIIEGNRGLSTTGCSRTGCVFCLFGLRQDKPQNRIQRLAITHPKLHDYCINKLGLKEVMEFMGDPYIPERDIYNTLLAHEYNNIEYFNKITMGQ